MENKPLSKRKIIFSLENVVFFEGVASGFSSENDTSGVVAVLRVRSACLLHGFDAGSFVKGIFIIQNR